MARTPKQTKTLPLPESEENIVKLPMRTDDIQEVPDETTDVPETPEETKEVPEQPEATALNKEVPSIYNEENTVVIGDTKIEIKPTKLKYFRNKTASVYNLIKAIPLTEFFNFKKGAFGDPRDPDQILFDFLIAVFDSSEFVRDHYDEIDAATIERALSIFGRLNGIDDKEEQARKNREAQASP